MGVSISILTVVTCFYNIGRENIDGRSEALYLHWLEETIKLFPNIVIFHNQAFSDPSLKFPKTVKTIHFPFNEFWVSEYRELIERICNSNLGHSSDITFRLPQYAMLQLSKFEFLSQAQKISDSKSLLWVDAGISRFVGKHSISQPESIAKRLLQEGYDSCFELDLGHNIDLRKRRIKNPAVGTNKKVIGGGSFWISSEVSADLNCLVRQEIKNWLANSLWDNEQIMLRNLAKKWTFKSKYLASFRGGTASVARYFLGSGISHLPFDRLWTRMLK